MSVKAATEPAHKVCDLYAEQCGIAPDDGWFLLKIQEELGELMQAHLKLTALHCRRFGINPDEAIQRKWLSWLDKAA